MPRRTPLPALAAAFLAACSPEVGPAGHATTEPPQVPTIGSQRRVEPRLPVLPAPSSPPSAPVLPPPPAFSLTELAPSQGALVPLLQSEFLRAKAKGQRPYVEFYADWCPPCRTLDRAMAEPQMMEALRGTYLIKLNLDDWHDKLPGTGFEPKFIPAFYSFGPEGRPAGRSFIAATWGKQTSAASMASTLLSFFQG